MASRMKRYRLLCAAAVTATILGLTGVTPAAAQDTTHVLTAVQLKRLGAAVDGYRNCEIVWVVMKIVGYPEVALVTPDSGQAAFAADSLDSEWHYYGPFQTECEREGKDPPGALFFPYCHDLDSDRCDTTEDVVSLLPLEGDSVSVVYFNPVRGDTVWSITLPPWEFDAYLWGMAAIDKFMVPHWVSVHGVAVAASMREAVRLEMEERFFNRRE